MSKASTYFNTWLLKVHSDLMGTEWRGHDAFWIIITEHYCKEKKLCKLNFSQEYEAPEQGLNSGLLKHETVVFRYWIVTFGLSHPEFLSKFSRNGFVFNCESDQKCLKLEDQKRIKQIKQINNCKTSANCNTAEHNRHCSNNKSTNSLPFYQEIKQCCLKQ